MAKASIRDRLAKLEDQWWFLDWFVRHRLNGQPEELDSVEDGSLPEGGTSRISREV